VAVTKQDFYAGKRIASVEWWLAHCNLPEIVWARLRVFDDGTADACRDEGGTLYGFDEELYAGYFLGEDEYIPFSSMDAEHEQEFGIVLDEIQMPSWSDRIDQAFTYLGTY